MINFIITIISCLFSVTTNVGSNILTDFLTKNNPSSTFIWKSFYNSFLSSFNLCIEATNQYPHSKKEKAKEIKKTLEIYIGDSNYHWLVNIFAYHTDDSFSDFLHQIKDDKIFKQRIASDIIKKIPEYKNSNDKDEIIEVLTDVLDHFYNAFISTMTAEEGLSQLLLIASSNQGLIKVCQEEISFVASNLLELKKIVTDEALTTRNYIFSRGEAVKKDVISEIEKVGKTTQDNINTSIANLEKSINSKFGSSEIIGEYKSQLDEIKELFKQQNYRKALEKLEKLKSKLNEKQITDSKLLFQTAIYSSLCEDRMGNHKNAALLLIEAYKYNSDKASGIFAGIQGYKSLNKQKERNDLEKQLLEKHPFELETFIYKVQIKQDDISTILSEMPEKFGKSPELNHTIANYYFSEDDDENYILYMEKAIKCSDNEGRTYKPILAYHLSKKYASVIHTIKKKYIPKEDLPKLTYAIQLYQEVWEFHAKTERQANFSHLPLNISTIYEVLGDYDKAIEWIDIALDAMDNPWYKNHKIFYLKKSGNIKAAIEYCQTISDFNHPELKDCLILFSEMLYNTQDKGNIIKAKSLLNEFIASSEHSTHLKAAKHLLIHIYLQTNEIDNAQLFIEELEDGISRLILESKVKYFRGELETSNFLLDKALRLVTEETIENELHDLGVVLTGNERYEEAIPIFERFLSPKEPTFAIKTLFVCYDKVGKLDKILAFCQNYRQVKGLDRNLTETEIQFLLLIKDFDNAIPLMEEYCQKFEDNYEIKIRLAGVFYIYGEFEKAEALKLEAIPIESINFGQIRRVINLLILINKKDEALDFAYRVRNLKGDKSRAHEEMVFTETKVINDKSLKVDTVEKDTVVSLENKNKKVKFIILDKEKPDTSKSELNLKSPIFQLLKGKKVGDKVTLPTEQVFEIKEIIHKYTFAFRDSLDKLDNEFSFENDLNLVLGHIEDPETFIEKQFEKSEQYEKAKEEVRSLYNQKVISLGCLANHMHRSPIELWSTLRYDEKWGINYSFGFKEEAEQIKATLEKTELAFCVDVTAILALYHLEMGEYILENYGKLNITYSTLDLFQQKLLEEKSELGRESFTLFVKDGVKYKYERTKEITEQNIKSLENIIDWIRKYCNKPLPINLLLQTTKEERDKQIQILGDSFYETLLIAKEHNFVLLSDECVLKTRANIGYGVKSIGSLDLLKKLRETSNNRDLFNSKILQTYLWNYKTSIEFEVLLKAVELDNGTFDNFLHLFQIKVDSQNTATIFHSVNVIRSAFEFLNLYLWQSQLDNRLKNETTLKVLDQLVNEFDLQTVFHSLYNGFHQIGVSDEVLYNLFEEWYDKKMAIIKPEIQYKDFTKLDIRTGTIIDATAFETNNHWIYLTIDFGFETRNTLVIFSEAYQPKSFIGISLCALLNMKPIVQFGKTINCRVLMVKGKYGGEYFVTAFSDEKGLPVSLVVREKNKTVSKIH